LHLVFAVKNRQSLIRASWKSELYKYITGIIHHQKHKLIAINGMSDHIHILIGFKPVQSLSDLLQDIKSSSSKWINDKKLVYGKFSWQEGYGAFSYSQSHLSQVVDYIEQQEKHHAKKSFREEYVAFLKMYHVDYDSRFLLSGVDDEEENTLHP
jgi:REP element-mobilizing transposase RayT